MDYEPRRHYIRRTSSSEELKEHPDPTPLELPTGLGRPVTLRELVQQYCREEISQAATEAGAGSFLEEDDFEADDDDADLVGPYDVIEMDPEGPPDSLEGEEEASPAPPPPPVGQTRPGEPIPVQAGNGQDQGAGE